MEGGVQALRNGARMALPDANLFLIEGIGHHEDAGLRMLCVLPGPDLGKIGWRERLDINV